ncbi:unnamed protein product [Caenorhabditis sp. 36 PRJEB53466]|nr:unnamed protein product [Caenorhabditis sp. 36 PRJEB53466]
MDCEDVHHEEIVSLTDNDSIGDDIPNGAAPVKDGGSFSTESPPILTPCNVQKPNGDIRTSQTDSEFPNETPSDVIFDGDHSDDAEVEYKVLFDEKSDEDGNDVEIDVRGVKYKIPYAIECHLCNEMMNLCLRRTRYRGQTREYPAYRCNRKGCQTFRSIRKVFTNCVTETSSEGRESPKMVYQPSLDTNSPKCASKSQSIGRGEFSEDDSDDFVIQRVFLPKPSKRIQDSCVKLPSVHERVRKANQERSVAFTEFSDQLRRDIAANKRIRVRKQINDDNVQQGTLFYISKELTPQEIIELQDSVIKTLISLRKIPPPMSMLDLPLFAHCPYTKKELETGLESTKYQADFWRAFTSAPQPPLPVGFIRRKDDTLIYKDPKPYEVPTILQQNSPRKQAEAVLNYRQRKGEQDAKRMERRHTEKKYRSWASLKREFDMAETDDCPTNKHVRASFKDSSVRSDKKSRKVTLQELIDKMEGDSNGFLTAKIRAGTSQRNCESMQWIDDQSFPETVETGGSKKKGDFPQHRHEKLEDDVFDNDRRFKNLSSMQDMMRNLSTPPMRVPISPMIRSFSSSDHIEMRNSTAPMFFSDVQINNNSPFYTYLTPFQVGTSLETNSYYQSRDVSDEHYRSVGASEVVRTETVMTPFTYIHPDSGARFTDPSAFLTSFVPSPITKCPPVTFGEETTRPRRNSEPSTSTVHHEISASNRLIEKDDYSDEDNKKIMDTFLKFDPPSVENQS